MTALDVRRVDRRQHRAATAGATKNHNVEANFGDQVPTSKPP
jgi:hypothetical protein